MSYEITPKMHWLAHYGVCVAIETDNIPLEVRIYNASDTLLASIAITDPNPATAVNGTSGQLTLAGTAAADPVVTGAPDYALLVGQIDAVWETLASMPCVSADPQPGECYVTPFAIEVGTPVSIGTLTFG